MSRFMLIVAMLCISSPTVAQEPTVVTLEAPPAEEEMLRQEVAALKGHNARLTADVAALTQVTRKLVDMEKARRVDKPSEVMRHRLPSVVFLLLPVVASSAVWLGTAAANERPLGPSLALGALAGVTSGSILATGYVLEDAGILIGGSLIGIAALLVPVLR